jgi:amidohydrolase
MVFHGVGSQDGSGPGLHHPRFAPGDEHIAAVARVMMAGYLAGCDRVLGHTHASG